MYEVKAISNSTGKGHEVSIKKDSPLYEAHVNSFTDTIAVFYGKDSKKLADEYLANLSE